MSYRYIKNPRATKFYSLEFEVIPGMTQKYQQVVILKDRIHFFSYNKLDHAMYIIGSKKGIVSLPTSKPIIGILYDYIDQPLENDRFLLVDDVSKTKMVANAETGKLEKQNYVEGRLTVLPIILSPSSIFCQSASNTKEYVEKLVVETQEAIYKVTLHIAARRQLFYNPPRIVDIAWGVSIGLVMIVLSFFWY